MWSQILVRTAAGVCSEHKTSATPQGLVKSPPDGHWQEEVQQFRYSGDKPRLTIQRTKLNETPPLRLIDFTASRETLQWRHCCHILMRVILQPRSKPTLSRGMPIISGRTSSSHCSHLRRTQHWDVLLRLLSSDFFGLFFSPSAERSSKGIK